MVNPHALTELGTSMKAHSHNGLPTLKDNFSFCESTDQRNISQTLMDVILTTIVLLLLVFL